MNALRRLRRDMGFVSTFGRGLGPALRAAPARRVEFSDALAEHFQRRPDQPALIGEASRMTWGELDRFANRVANWALGQGLERGDVVALLMENRAEYVATWIGLSRVGVVTALLNTNLVGDRLAHCIREADTRYMIVGSELAEGAASAMPELETKPALLIASFDAEADEKAASLLEATSFDAACDAAGDGPVPEPVRAARKGADDLFYIYTSGTTGLPKAAHVSHSKAMTAGTGCWKFQGLTPADKLYCCLPLYHSAGGMMATCGILMAGGTLVIARKFSASRFWSDCVQHEITVFQYIGELCRYLLNSPPHPDENRHRIRTALGNGLRPEVWGPFAERFKLPKIIEFYGATEGNMILLNHEGRVGAIGYLPAFLRKAQGVVIARFDVVEETVVRGDDGFCIEADLEEPGELLMKINATQRFEGYTNEEASKKKILRDVFEKGDAYFRTGDLLKLDEDGFFYFVDRIGDTFRWKGENVSTNEVAEVLSVEPGIEEANVYGVEVPGADGRAGMAALVTTDAFDLEAFGRRVEQELAFYARPLFVRLLPQMEITGTFKHRKVDLVKEGFDPTQLEDAVYYRDPEKASYVPLDPIAYDRIANGEIRI
ncbi:MAG: long-chain-acyl-CoA synthetase [Myxococcota bacterium]